MTREVEDKAGAEAGAPGSDAAAGEVEDDASSDCDASTFNPNAAMISYPHIQSLKHVAKEIAYITSSAGPDALPATLRYWGTVKLHGTHADMRQAHAGAPLVVQSRNRVLTPQSDNCGFARFVHANTAAFERMFAEVRAMIAQDYTTAAIAADNDSRAIDAVADASAAPAAAVDPDAMHIMLAGEWCGKGIQKRVAVGTIAKPFFTIFDVRVGPHWHDVRPFSAVLRDEAARVRNIAEFPTWQVEVPRDDPLAAEPALQALAEEVGSACPVGAALGHPGRGEGIVFRCMDRPGSSRLWFKAKCEAHSVSVARKPDNTEKAAAKVGKQEGAAGASAAGNDAITAAAAEFVAAHVREARLHQGLDYLREHNKPVADLKSIGAFVNWVMEDTLREEGSDIADMAAALLSGEGVAAVAAGSSVEERLVKACKKGTGEVASRWFKAHVAAEAAATVRVTTTAIANLALHEGAEGCSKGTEAAEAIDAFTIDL